MLKQCFYGNISICKFYVQNIKMESSINLVVVTFNGDNYYVRLKTETWKHELITVNHPWQELKGSERSKQIPLKIYEA